MNLPAERSTTEILDATGRVAGDLKCVQCAYNLRTLAADGTCPECGQPVALTLAGYLPVLDETGRVAADIPCIQCGYNLRTQPIGGRCPECAASVAQSARGQYLNQAPPKWVRADRIGVFTVESRAELGRDLDELGIPVFQQKVASLPDTILEELISALLAR